MAAERITGWKPVVRPFQQQGGRPSPPLEFLQFGSKKLP
jgi:hypothetical protein